MPAAWWAEISTLGHVLLAMALGAAVGVERELLDKPAGFRTHMLVAGAAALLVAIAQIMVRLGDGNADAVRADPIRIVEAVITGVSFLGAGTIIRQRRGNHVEGLTTAASLLFVASLGIVVALHQYVLAIGGTLLTLAVLRAGKLFERVKNK